MSRKMSKEYEELLDSFKGVAKMKVQAQQDGVLASIFLALGDEKPLYISQRYYLILRDIIFKAQETCSYEGENKVITIKDETENSNLIIELIEVKIEDIKVYLIRKVKAKNLEYSNNTKVDFKGNILLFEDEHK
ncbi:MAG: hypothetical protein E7311_07290 [Clostridiales bacterium]|nr:hypothetical protein [Clostridiales bacterium]